MAKSRDAFRTISEVSDWLGVPAHVLRFWESRFNQIKPMKRAGGRRYYRPGDMQLLGGIRRLLHEDGITIKGVQKILREKGVKHVAALCVETFDDGDREGGADSAAPPESQPESQAVPASAPKAPDAAPSPPADTAAPDPAPVEAPGDAPGEAPRTEDPTPAGEASSPPPPPPPPPPAPLAPDPDPIPRQSPAAPLSTDTLRPDVLTVREIDEGTRRARMGALYERLANLHQRLRAEMTEDA